MIGATLILEQSDALGRLCGAFGNRMSLRFDQRKYQQGCTVERKNWLFAVSEVGG